jgi:hypothetical protein
MYRAVANRKWCELQPLFVAVKAMCSGRRKRLKLAFSGPFSLLRFFWASKRNEEEK